MMPIHKPRQSQKMPASVQKAAKTVKRYAVKDRVVLHIDGEFWAGTVVRAGQIAMLVNWDDPDTAPDRFVFGDKAIVGRLPKSCKKRTDTASIPRSELRSWFRPEEETSLAVVGQEPESGVKSIEGLRERTEVKKAGLVEDVKEVEDLLKTPTFTENTHMKVYASLYENLKQIIERAEERCKKSNRSTDIYALMQLYNQQREVIADIRATTDFSQQANKLVHNVLRPLISDVGQSMIDVMYALGRDVREVVDQEDYKKYKKMSDDYMKEYGRFLQQCYIRASDQVNALLTQK